MKHVVHLQTLQHVLHVMHLKIEKYQDLNAYARNIFIQLDQTLVQLAIIHAILAMEQLIQIVLHAKVQHLEQYHLINVLAIPDILMMEIIYVPV